MLKVPMVYNPLQYTFTYLLKDSNTLIDTGLDGAVARASLGDQLRKAGTNPAAIKQIIITHAHRDHIGLVNYLVSLSGAKVYTHERVKQALENTTRRNSIDEIQSELTALGADALQSILTQYANTTVQLPPPPTIDETVSDGSVFTLTNVNLKVVWTPGHSPDHICLHDNEHKLLFSGDHVLPTISPNVSLHTYEPGNPLGDYLNSLTKVRNLPVELVLPAHEHTYRGLAKRVDELKIHHDVRSREIIDALKERNKTVFEISGQVSWSSPWDLMSVWIKRQAMAETYAHLIHLGNTGKIKERLVGGVLYYGS